MNDKDIATLLVKCVWPFVQVDSELDCDRIEVISRGVMAVHRNRIVMYLDGLLSLPLLVAEVLTYLEYCPDTGLYRLPPSTGV